MVSLSRSFTLLSFQVSDQPSRHRSLRRISRRRDTVDRANAVLTTTVEEWGWSWIPRATSAAYGPLSRPILDPCERTKPPEKRKVGTAAKYSNPGAPWLSCATVCTRVRLHRLTVAGLRQQFASRRPEPTDAIAPSVSNEQDSLERQL
jgi:hypothetical protein